MWPFHRKERNTYEAAALLARKHWLKVRGSQDPIDIELAASTAIKTLLAAAVQTCSVEAKAVEYLRSNDVPEMLRTAAAITSRTLEKLKTTGELETAVENNITFVHVAWLLDDWETGDSILQVCVDRTARDHFPLTPFWREYYRGMEHLATLARYTYRFDNPKAYEKYWVPYLKLIECLTQEQNPQKVISEIRSMFLRRNSDKRLVDWKGIDGDGRRPAIYRRGSGKLRPFLRALRCHEEGGEEPGCLVEEIARAA